MEFEEIEDEDTYVLRELDRLRDELSPRTASPTSRPQPEVIPPSEGERTPLPAGAPSWGQPSPYLEERLIIARSAVSELVAQSRGVGRSLEGLRNALATIDQELDRASAEIGFLRADQWEDQDVKDVAWRVPTPHSPPLGHPGPAVVPSVVPPSRAASTIAGSFEDFTLERYNHTIGELHARRRALGWGTVVAAAGISAVLLFLTLQAHEPVPVIWLAFLPLVWMIPVPFFVAAFRGTQRVLRRNRLELPE